MCLYFNVSPVLHRAWKYLLLIFALPIIGCGETQTYSRPNFLLVISDDQSWMHTSYAGDKTVQTPNFDAIAQQGLYFKRAYASAPTCTASRSAVLSGQHFWRTGAGSVLWGEYPSTLINYQQILQENGYFVGYTGKGWGPGKSYSRLPDPAGHEFNSHKHDVPKHISINDYAENLKNFIAKKDDNQPFSFWVGFWEPHRPYKYGIGSEHSVNPKSIDVPPFLPDSDTVRNDLADYYFEIQWSDHQLGRIIQVLKDSGELENTVIVVTSDNGMPFPRAKSNNYDSGVRVPFAMAWPAAKTLHRNIETPVSLIDIAPTFLSLAGVSRPEIMSGTSLRPVLFNEGLSRKYVYSGFNRHIASARLGNKGYPVRAIHSVEYSYIRNLRPDLMPAGNPPGYDDIDNASPSKRFLLKNQDTERYFLNIATAKRPPAELYKLSEDPFQLDNIVNNNDFAHVLQEMKSELISELSASHDPALSNPSQIDRYIYHGTN